MGPRRSLTAVCTAVIAVAGRVGCGGSGPGPAGVVQTYIHAFLAGDGQTACKQLTPQVANQLAQDAQQAGLTGSCAAVLTKGRNLLSGTQGAQALQNATYALATETGNTATVHVSANNRTVTIHLAKIGGNWYIDQVNPLGGGSSG